MGRAREAYSLKAVGVAALLLVAFGAFAAEESDERTARIEEALRLSGAAAMLETLPELIGQQVDLGQPQLTPEVRRQVRAALDGAYDPARMNRELVDEVAKRHQAAPLEGALAAMRSPLARKLTALEVEASQPEAAEELLAFAGRLPTNPPSPERHRLILRIDEITRSTDVAQAVHDATLLGLLRAATVARGEPLDELEEFERKLAESAAQRREGMHNQVVLSLLFTYRAVPEAELAKYVKLLESDSLRWFNDVVSQGLVVVLTRAAERAGDELAVRGDGVQS